MSTTTVDDPTESGGTPNPSGDRATRISYDRRRDHRAEARRHEAEFARLLRGVKSEPDPVPW